MIAGLLVDQTGTVAFVSPRPRKNTREREKEQESPNALCCSLANRQLWDDFRCQGLRQYPFCGNEMYFNPARSIHLRPAATLVETYC